MGSVTVKQVLVTPLNRISVAGGDVLHVMKCNDPGFVNFGEAYFSMIELNAIKAWKRHCKMTLNLVVPIGLVQFVLVDDRGRVREEVIGSTRYARLTVPPGLWFGFRGLVAPYSLLMNIADIEHNPAESEHKELGEIIFEWETK